MSIFPLINNKSNQQKKIKIYIQSNHAPHYICDIILLLILFEPFASYYFVTVQN